MKVFITGGTGYIGSAVVAAFARDGHEVCGLVRSATAADAMRSCGGQPVLGEITSPDSYREVAASSDALIHAAVGKNAVEVDKIAIDTLLAAAAGGKCQSFVYTSGVWILGNTGDKPADETASTSHPAAKVSWRPAHEQRVLLAATPRLATAVIRPGVVYGEKRGLLAGFFSSAISEGAVETIGDGNNRWSLIHRDDLAEFYRLVVSKNGRGIFHAVDDAPLPVKELAAVAGKAAGKSGKTRSVPLAEARERLGELADALVMDQVVVSSRARELGWHAEHTSFATSAKQAFKEWRDEHFETMYARAEPPPWEIGRPQQAISSLLQSGKIKGRVLDIGCGTGEHALSIARKGLEVVGTDIAATAITRARRKTAEQKLNATFVIDNALSFNDEGGSFDTIIDSGLFHVFDDEDRARYVETLRRLLKPGGNLFILCFSSDEPGDWGPRRVARDEFAQAFKNGWAVRSVEEARFENFVSPQGSAAWLASVERV